MTVKQMIPYLIAFTVAVMVTAVVIGLSAVIPLLILWGTMLLFVAFANSRPKPERKFIRRCMAVVLLICTVWATVTLVTYPVAAIAVTGEPVGSQIVWNVSEGVAPYNVWMNGDLLFLTYPADSIITDAEPGKTYQITVQDNLSMTATANAAGLYYTYPIEIWLLFALLVGLIIASYFVPYTAFGAAMIGGFLMMVIGPNPDYVGYLRLIACAAFIAGLGTIFIGGNR